MNQRDDLDRMLSAWVDDPYSPPAPHYLSQVLERTRRTRQRPAWTYPERWIPMADKLALPTTGAPPRLAWVLLIALLAAALVTAVLVGSRLLERTPSPLPVGGSAVFTFASFVGNDSGQTGGDIYTVSADGTNLRQLTKGPGIRAYPAFSPDGTRIAYRDRAGGFESIVVMDTGGRNGVVVATHPLLLQDCPDMWSLAWSPDGTHLVVPAHDSCGGSFGLRLVAADGSSPARDLLAPGLNGIFPSWSPDGRRIAFHGSEATGASGLYVADIGASGDSGPLKARRIGPEVSPTLADSTYGPRWSPDGTELAVTSVKQGFFITEAEGVYIVKADGSGQRLVAARAGNPAWSPDGRQLAIHRTVDRAEYWNGRPCTVRIWIINADGTNERRLEPLADGCEGPVLWSPDGSRVTGVLIASTADEPALGFHAGVVTVDGTSPVVLLQDGAPTHWQPVAAPLPAAPSFAPAAAAP